MNRQTEDIVKLEKWLTFLVLIVITQILAIGKLTGYFDFSWWWVFTPFWIVIGIAVMFIITIEMILS